MTGEVDDTQEFIVFDTFTDFFIETTKRQLKKGDKHEIGTGDRGAYMFNE